MECYRYGLWLSRVDQFEIGGKFELQKQEYENLNELGLRYSLVYLESFCDSNASFGAHVVVLQAAKSN